MPLYSYPCLVYRQRPKVEGSLTFGLLHAPVGEILEWAAIKRLEDEAGAPQRRASPAKVGAIKNFLKNEPINTIPTSIIITIDLPSGYQVKILRRYKPGSSEYLGMLEFEMEEGNPQPGLIIDGQHRLLGMRNFNPQLNVNVVAILNADDIEKAFQFLVINNKVSKVSRDHIRALALHYEKQKLNDRLKSARLTLDANVGFVGLVDSEKGSPFYGIISWPKNPEEQRIIPPSAIEKSISYIQQKKLRSFESDDIVLEFYYSIWNTVKEEWTLVWNQESKLLTKVGIICFTQYITDALVSWFDWGRLDVSDPEKIVTHVKKLLCHQKEQFWAIPWKSSSYDTKSGRALIIESLVQISRNLRANETWYLNVNIVDIALLEKKDVKTDD